MPTPVKIDALADTWADAGTVFRGINLDVTNTASHADSLLQRLAVDSVEKFAVGKDGVLRINGLWVRNSGGNLEKSTDLGVSWWPLRGANTFYVLMTGQSNALGQHSGSEDQEPYAAVEVWNTLSAAWEVFDPSTLQGWNPVINRHNIAFHFAKKLHEFTLERVRVIISGAGGRPISDWVPDSAEQYVALKAMVEAAEVPRLDFILWNQGEEDTKTGPTPAATYIQSFNDLIDQFRAETWADDNTTIIAGQQLSNDGLRDLANGYLYDQAIFKEDFHSKNVYLAETKDYSSKTDNIHYDARALIDSGRKAYWNALMERYGVPQRIGPNPPINARSGMINQSSSASHRGPSTNPMDIHGDTECSLVIETDLPNQNGTELDFLGVLAQYATSSTTNVAIYRTAETLVFRVRTDAGIVEATTHRRLSVGRHRFVLTFKDGQLNGYRDGELIAATSGGAQIATNSGGSNTWVVRGCAPGGMVFSMRYFNRALSAKEVPVASLSQGMGGADMGHVSTVALTSGLLVIGRRYRITNFVAGDDFTNVGAASNANGVTFVATGTTPTTWSNSSGVKGVGLALDLRPDGVTESRWLDASGNNWHGASLVSMLPFGYSGISGYLPVGSLLFRENSGALEKSIDGGVSWSPFDRSSTWTTRTSAADNDWRSIAYGNGRFVAVAITGTGNRVMTSTDGVNWTTRTSASDNDWRSVCFGNGLFVAVSSTGTGTRVMTSPDGITWTTRTSAANNSWYGVCYGNGLFVAVSITGTGNRVMTSPDGITWTIRTSAADNSWRSVAYGNGRFVAVASTGSGNRVMTSTDGITWTLRTSAADNDWYGVCYGNGLFVAVASTGTGNRVMTSPDGITWTIRTSAADNSWFSVCYGNGLFISAAGSGTGTRVMTSTDGITWTIRTSAADNDWYGVAYGNGLYVAVAVTGTGTRVMTSGAQRDNFNL